MDIHHVRAKLNSLGHGAGDRIRNIMELQIQKNLFPLRLERRNGSRAGTAEQLASDFIPGHRITGGLHKIQCVLKFFKIKRDNKLGLPFPAIHFRLLYFSNLNCMRMISDRITGEKKTRSFHSSN